MSDTTSVPTKPKRVLTEAQRLAFLKGREKRMANIMKKREEKLEAEQMEFVDEPVPEVEAKPDPKPVEEIQEPPKKKRRVATKITVAAPTSVPVSPPTKIPDEPDMSSLPPIMTVEDRDMLLEKFKTLEEMTSKLLSYQDGKSSNKENVSPRANSVPPSPPILKRRKVSAPPPPKRPTSSLQNVFNWA